MSKLKYAVPTLAFLLATASVGVAAENKANANAPGQDRVCLITFNKAGTSANADVTGAKILPRKAADLSRVPSPARTGRRLASG